MNLFLLQSSNRNFPTDTQKILQDLGCSLVAFGALSEIMETPLRKMPFVCILEVGGAEELERAYLAQEWCETIQPFSRGKFIYLLASKHIAVDESKTRGSEIVHLPLVPRNLLFKIELQSRLLEKEPEKKPNALGFRGERISTQGEKKRVFSFTGPKKGKWESAGFSPSGKVRWRWISSEPMDVSKTFGLSWISRSDAPPKLDETSGEWLIEGEDGDVLCQKQGTDLISLREQLVRGKALLEAAAETVKGKNDLLPEEENKSLSSSIEESEKKVSGLLEESSVEDVVESDREKLADQQSWKNRQGESFERKQQSRESRSSSNEEIGGTQRASDKNLERISSQKEAGDSAEEILANKKVTTETLSSQLRSKGGDELTLRKQGDSPGLEGKNTQKTLEQSSAFSSLHASLPQDGQKKEMKSHSQEIAAPLSSSGAGSKEAEEKKTSERSSLAKEEDKKREAEARAAQQQRERQEQERIARARENRERELNPREQVSLEAKSPHKAERPLEEEGKNMEKETVSLSDKKRASENSTETNGEEEALQRSGGEVPHAANSTILVEGRKNQESKVVERFSRPQEEKISSSSFSQIRQAEKFFDPLSQRAFFILTLAELSDQNSVWYPVDGYRIYLSAEARYKDFSKINFFPLWIYQGELAPEFLEFEKAWKFYDRPPEMRMDPANLPPEILSFLLQERLEVSQEILEALRRKGVPVVELMGSDAPKKGFMAWVKRLLGF